MLTKAEVGAFDRHSSAHGLAGIEESTLARCYPAPAGPPHWRTGSAQVPTLPPGQWPPSPPPSGGSPLSAAVWCTAALMAMQQAEAGARKPAAAGRGRAAGAAAEQAGVGAAEAAAALIVTRYAWIIVTKYRLQAPENNHAPAVAMLEG